jgi:TolA-binding protein
MKKFNKFEIANLKRVAQMVNPIVNRKNKIKSTIEELEKELQELNAEQQMYESPIKEMTGGYTSEDLVDKVIEDTGKKDKNGNPSKITKFVLKYPDTIIPMVEKAIEDEATEPML